MKIETLVWESVTVHCPSDISLNEAFDIATITFNQDIRSLGIREKYKGRTQKSLLYAKAELVKLTPWSVEFKACWLSSKIDSDEVTLIPVTVTATF